RVLFRSERPISPLPSSLWTLVEELVVKMSPRFVAFGLLSSFRAAIGAALAVVLAFGGSSSLTVAAPDSAATSMTRAQNVDWMSAEAAASLDLPMDVMVPTWVPEPFNEVAPSVSGSGGYYELYW